VRDFGEYETKAIIFWVLTFSKYYFKIRV